APRADQRTRTARACSGPGRAAAPAPRPPKAPAMQGARRHPPAGRSFLPSQDLAKPICHDGRNPRGGEADMAFELPPLPYPKNALEPHTSAQTLDFHHGRHHQTYVTNLNNLVKDTPMESQSLEDIIRATAKDASKAGIFNNAAQVWNHTFFWNCMKPNCGGHPS